MYIALISLIVLACVLLVLVVLAQNSKGGGLSSQFGGAGTSQLMGVKRTGDLLEKLTWSFAVAVMALSLTSHMILDKDNTATDGPASINVERARGTQQQGPTLPDNNLDATQQPGSPNEQGPASPETATPGDAAPATTPAQ